MCEQRRASSNDRIPERQAPHVEYAMFNGHPYFGENALRLEADPAEEATQDGFLARRLIT